MSMLVKIFRRILCCSEEDERDYETRRRDSLLGTSYYSSSVTSSSRNNHDLLRRQNPNSIYYYEYYPNASISSPTTKKPSAVSQQSDDGNNSSVKGTNGVSQFSKSSRPAPPSSSYYTCPSSSPKPPSFTFDQHQPSAKPPASSQKPSPSPSKSSPSLGGSSQSTSLQTPSSLKASTLSKPTLSPLPLDSKNQQTQGNHVLVHKNTSPTLPPLPPDSTNQQKKDSYMWVQKETSSVYKIPKDIEDLIKKDIVPGVLKKPLSPSTYKDFFASLLYAEDFYCEKWSDFQLLGVTLELREAAIYDKSLLKNNHLKTSHEKDDKLFVAFKIENVPERRPFLLSRDFVYAQRSGGKTNKFQGLLYRVVRSTTVLVEFEEGFYPQHRPSHKYDISFSFNRVCLKRAHHAVSAASDPLFHNYLFPDLASRKSIPSSSPRLYCNYKLDSDINSAVHQILSFKGPPPYLVEGPLCVCRATRHETRHEFVLSKTGIVVGEAALQIYRCSPKSRILICAPINKTCDVLMENLMENIPESDMFRANAAFREVDTVPGDVLQASLLEGECFSCPSLQELRQYRVIFSTFVSSFRLHNEGITGGHFSHIFLVDTSSAIEPEILIALSNLANENTTVIVTGAPRNCSSWVRSDIARRNGLKKSYFERLCQTKTYCSCNSMFFTRLQEERGESDSFSSFSYVD